MPREVRGEEIDHRREVERGPIAVAPLENGRAQNVRVLHQRGVVRFENVKVLLLADLTEITAGLRIAVIVPTGFGDDDRLARVCREGAFKIAIVPPIVLLPGAAAGFVERTWIVQLDAQNAALKRNFPAPGE